jgi:hypothetical protein
MTIEIKKQETKVVTESVIKIELPYYFLTNEYDYSKKCFAVMEDLTMFTMYMSDTYQSMSMQPGSIEQIEKMLNDAFSKYENRKEITNAEFESLVDEFNQRVLSNKTTQAK